ncbi:MAG: hypothetical protein ACK55I_44620, partial [bacterium]
FYPPIPPPPEIIIITDPPTRWFNWKIWLCNKIPCIMIPTREYIFIPISFPAGDLTGSTPTAASG